MIPEILKLFGLVMISSSYDLNFIWEIELLPWAFAPGSCGTISDHPRAVGQGRQPTRQRGGVGGWVVGWLLSGCIPSECWLQRWQILKA